MALPQTYVWPAATSAEISASQTVLKNGYLQLTSPFQAMSGRFPGFSRTIAFSSSKDCSGSEILVQGLLNGQIVEEIVQGPKGTAEAKATVETKQLFSTLNTIQILNNDAPDLSASLGSTGILGWFLFNFQSSYPALSLATDVKKGDKSTISWQLVGTLDDLNQVTDPKILTFGTTVQQTDQRDSLFWTGISGPLRYVALRIKNASPEDELSVTFLQQGIN